MRECSATTVRTAPSVPARRPAAMTASICRCYRRRTKGRSVGADRPLTGEGVVLVVADACAGEATAHAAIAVDLRASRASHDREAEQGREGRDHDALHLRTSFRCVER